MGNSWSFLYDEMNMAEHSKYYYDYNRNDLDRENPFDCDTLKLDGYSVNGVSIKDFLESDCMENKIKSNYDEFIMSDIIPESKTTPWKYNEEEILRELLEYVRGTYNQHYSAGDDKIQTLDLIEACGDGEAFCRSNILKYASRYDKKGTARRDIMKIMHYAVLLMYFNDKNAQRETYPQ